MIRINLIKKRGDKSQKSVADSIGITTSYYGMIELGVRNPSLDVAMDIANYYNTSIEDLFFDNISSMKTGHVHK
ncbi:helix-turn-helix transcriptional regulator [Vallitalea guaymasensis]|uniref:Helix-turn-helix transcriptional regulator n=1 Tax=Vallitalea guaymasensis TaxID=1185412 RepID=A0A8J8MEC7_9FIRM|nr:helix-turn-helix transcriptional regulator [Vallitalea guaymasensis]QUH31356.1 helix-turn-helix transcriptional regulator [Vallitalea guaymasensis]